jgi:hypothetical protein
MKKARRIIVVGIILALALVTGVGFLLWSPIKEILSPVWTELIVPYQKYVLQVLFYAFVVWLGFKDWKWWIKIIIFIISISGLSLIAGTPLASMFTDWGYIMSLCSFPLFSFINSLTIENKEKMRTGEVKPKNRGYLAMGMLLILFASIGYSANQQKKAKIQEEAKQTALALAAAIPKEQPAAVSLPDSASKPKEVVKPAPAKIKSIPEEKTIFGNKEFFSCTVSGCSGYFKDPSGTLTRIPNKVSLQKIGDSINITFTLDGWSISNDGKKTTSVWSYKIKEDFVANFGNFGNILIKNATVSEKNLSDGIDFVITFNI